MVGCEMEAVVGSREPPVRVWEVTCWSQADEVNAMQRSPWCRAEGPLLDGGQEKEGQIQEAQLRGTAGLGDHLEARGKERVCKSGIRTRAGPGWG